MILDKFDAVIFDLDGTLVDSMWLWKDIDIDYLARFNIPYEEELQSKIEGMSFTETAIYFKEHFKLDDSIEKIKEDWNEMAYDKYSHKVSLKKGVYSFLEYLKGLNKKIGIATSNSKELTLACINSLDISDFFDCIVTGSDVKKGKPAPDVYLENARLLEVLPEKCLVFEDIPVGLLAGRNAGMSTCSVYDEYSKDVSAEKLKLSDYNIVDYIDFKNKYLG
ncbi:MAG: HAD family phosphatase [Lachnospiraceae bacterium]|nr:HAD family phosphatase [Lachnospiraceae bacterium]MDE6698518.1 HAD family phosphatase [Lachnospiraceae bacterium]